jgi:hypothetical protein
MVDNRAKDEAHRTGFAAIFGNNLEAVAVNSATDGLHSSSSKGYCQAFIVASIAIVSESNAKYITNLLSEASSVNPVEIKGTDLFTHSYTQNLTIHQPGIYPDFIIRFTISYHLNTSS